MSWLLSSFCTQVWLCLSNRRIWLPNQGIQCIQNKSAWTRQGFAAGASSNLGHFAPTDECCQTDLWLPDTFPTDEVDKQGRCTAVSAIRLLQLFALYTLFTCGSSNSGALQQPGVLTVRTADSTGRIATVSLCWLRY